MAYSKPWEERGSCRAATLLANEILKTTATFFSFPLSHSLSLRFSFFLFAIRVSFPPGMRIGLGEVLLPRVTVKLCKWILLTVLAFTLFSLDRGVAERVPPWITNFIIFVRPFIRSFVRIGSKIKYDKRMRSKKKKIQTGRLFFLSFLFFFRIAFELKLRWSFLHQHRDRCVPGTRVTLVMKSRHRARTTLETPRAKHQSEDERTKSPTMPINEMETVVASTREHGRERKKN